MSEYTTCAECCGKGSLASNALCTHCEGTGRVRNTTQLLQRKMRVAIVGCLGRQEKIIEGEIYANLDIRFANRGVKYGISDLDILKRVDRIFVMSKFISHTLTQNLDRNKTTMIHGGFNSLKNALATLNASVRIDAPQLTHSEEDDDMARDGYDFQTQFNKAKVGDVLVFPREPKKTMKQWEASVSAARSYFKRKAGIHSDFEVKDNEIHVLITRIEKKQAEPIDIPPGTDPVYPAPYSEKPETFPAKLVDMGAEDQAFWRQVYLLSMQQNPGMQPSQHISVANQAVRGLHDG